MKTSFHLYSGLVMLVVFQVVGCGKGSHLNSKADDAGTLTANGFQCEFPTTHEKPSESGVTTVSGANDKPHSLYWIKFTAISQPSQGTLFYLAGGPLSHATFTHLAAAFQKLTYPQFDVILYDYYGFNCSSAIQDIRGLKTEFENFTMPAMAADFIELKRNLVGGLQKVMIMGGSHGSMLGAQIIHDYPNEIEKAILFSGDTESGWLANGWFRFDELLMKLEKNHSGFASNLNQLLQMAESGRLKVTIDGRETVVDRTALEFALWLCFSLDSSAQAALPDLVKSALEGNLDWVSAVYSAELSLIAPLPTEEPPTNVSVVTNFHRCNVWFPKSARTMPLDRQSQGNFLSFSSIVQYWNLLCKDYDEFGEFPFHATPTIPTFVPILSWVGDQDTFDPVASNERWGKLTSNLSFKVMEGWSHDFGTDPNSGFDTVVAMIKSFLQ